MSGIFENTLCSVPFQGNYLATASATADALDLTQTAALIEREGLRFDGTAGAVIGGGGYTIGTGDYSVVFQACVDSFSAAQNAFIDGQGSTAEISVRYATSGTWVLGSDATQKYISDTLVVATPYVIAAVRSAGVISLYRNGGLIGTVADTQSALMPRFMGILGAAHAWNGKMSRSSIFNYALTAAEIAALTRRGLVTLPEQRGGSMVALNTTTWTALNATQSVNTATTQTFTANPSAGGVGNTIAVVGGRPKRFRFSVTHAGITSGFSLVGIESSPSYGTNELSYSLPTAAGTYSFEYQTTSSSTAAEFRILHAGSGIATAFTGISIIPLGTLFEQDSGQRNAGYMVGDTSGNKLDLILPASGVSIIDPAQRGTIRFTTTTSGNQQIGGTQVIIPTNARISSWVINSSGTPNVTLGNVSAGAQYRASAAVVSGDNEITLLTRFTTTGNLWVNSSTTATLKHTIQWEYIQ